MHRVHLGHYLDSLTDETAAETFRWGSPRIYTWKIDEMLTQLNGHGWYHRGQIVQLVDSLGGEVVDTDFIFWTPTISWEE